MLFTWSLSPWLWALIRLVPRLSAIVANDATLRGLAFAFALGALSFEGSRQGRLHRNISLQALMRTNTTNKHVAKGQHERHFIVDRLRFLQQSVILGRSGLLTLNVRSPKADHSAQFLRQTCKHRQQ